MFKRVIVMLVLMMPLLISSVRANTCPCPEPAYGSAVIDGNVGEWNTSQDFFANLHRAGNSTKPIEAKLYLRYGCNTGTLYIMVKAEPGIPILDNPLDEHYVKLGKSDKLVDAGSGNDGTPPDFAWIGLNEDGTEAQGWEASTLLDKSVYDNFNVHTQVFDDGEEQTAAVAGRAICLKIVCPPTAVGLSEFTARNAHGVNEATILFLGLSGHLLFAIAIAFTALGLAAAVLWYCEWWPISPKKILGK